VKVGWGIDSMPKRWKMVHGYTHSRGASEAEARGEMPITRAVEVVYAALECKKHKVTKRAVRDFLENQCRRGWHHVAGPNGVRQVGYFATNLTEDQNRALLSTAQQTR
jgi:hypothetical protein